MIIIRFLLIKTAESSFTSSPKQRSATMNAHDVQFETTVCSMWT